ncbi:MAG: Poly-beta,6-N-acetyl-D-glucosamine synthase, partial [Planctomycetota bacterium]
MVDTIIAVAGWITFAGALIAGLPSVAALRLKRLVPAEAGQGIPKEWLIDSSQPVVSVIVPARNESPQIGTALRSLLSAETIPVEIIAVNDRSEDDTGRIMDEVAREDRRVTVLHISELPEGWLGKNHAMHKASQSARGRFLLFTDGDIHYQPG